MAEIDDALSSADVIRTVVDGALAAVIVMSADGVVRGWGNRAEATFGWSRSEAVGTELAQLVVPPEMRERHRQGVRNYLAGNGAGIVGRIVEMEAVRRSGEIFPVEISINPTLHREDGETLFIAFVMDITARRQSEETRVRLTEELRLANDALRDYTSLMVHQLRGPLAVIRGYASTLAEMNLPLDLTATTALGEIQRQAEAANGLVDSLMEAARIDSESVEPRLSKVSLEATVRAAVDRARPRAELLGGAVTASLAGPPEVDVVADAKWTANILDNLIANALIHSGPEPVVAVQVAVRPRPAITVCDQGPGIPLAIQERVFERFFRGPASSSTPGSGLGLYLSRRMAQRQGGDLTLAPDPAGGGACFKLELQAVRPA